MSIITDAKKRNPNFNIKFLREINIKIQGDLITFEAYVCGEKCNYSMPEVVIDTKGVLWELQQIKCGADVTNIYVSPKKESGAKYSEWWR